MKRVFNKNNFKRIMAAAICSVLLISMPEVSAMQAGTEVSVTTVSKLGTDSQENTNVDANGTLGKNSDVGIEVTKSITGKAGKEVNVAFNLKSNDPSTIKLKGVYPVIDVAFPFETSGDAYKVVSSENDAEKQKLLSASYKMTARSDLETGYQSVRFIGEYSKTAADGTVANYYVIKTINIYFTGAGSVSTEDSSGEKDDKEDEEDPGSDEDSDDGSSYSGGGDSYDDDESSGSDEVTAPKLVITGFDTKPEKIMAGQTFTLTIHIQNTSKTTPVCNAKFLIGNEAGTFLPTSGSSAVFVEKIEAGKTGDLEIEMKTSADLAQKNYILVIKGDFDDGRGNSFTSSDNLSVPVYQEVKLGVSEVSMTPEALGIDMSGSLMFTINNQGSAGVYNVSVSVDDPAVQGEESYVGNIAGSSSAYATLELTGVEENSDKGTVKVLISYEDSEGNKGKIEQQVECLVSDEAAFAIESDMEDMEGYEEIDEGVSVWVYIVAGIIALIVIAGIVVVIVMKRKKRMAELLEAEEDELDDEDF